MKDFKSPDDRSTSDRLRLPLRSFAAVGLGLLIVVLIGFFKEERREWRDHQARFEKMETERNQGAGPVHSGGLKQIMVPDLDRVDRCVTCHLGVDDPTYAGVPQPLSYHPDHDVHPFERFGCTVCHGGQGRATSAEDAHGDVEFWDEPMLPLTYIEASCAKCHDPRDNPAAPQLARGERLFEDNGCFGCHRVEGWGGSVGPALDASDHRPRRPEWLVEHFLDPSKVVPGSAMPTYGFSEEEAHDLTLFVLSLGLEPATGYHASRHVIAGEKRGERIFTEQGCLGCHSVGGRGGDVGPALDDVADRKTDTWLLKHFEDPQTTSPGTVMPQFGFSEGESRSLVLFLRSLSDRNGSLGIEPSTPAQRGEKLYRRYGCRGCHGDAGQGGVANPNAQSGQMVPEVRYVQEAYTVAQLKDKIRNGVLDVPRLDPNGPRPPLSMPAWGERFTEEQLNDLVAYLLSIYPEEEDLDW